MNKVFCYRNGPDSCKSPVRLLAKNTNPTMHHCMAVWHVLCCSCISPLSEMPSLVKGWLLPLAMLKLSLQNELPAALFGGCQLISASTSLVTSKYLGIANNKEVSREAPGAPRESEALPVPPWLFLEMLSSYCLSRRRKKAVTHCPGALIAALAGVDQCQPLEFRSSSAILCFFSAERTSAEARTVGVQANILSLVQALV